MRIENLIENNNISSNFDVIKNTSRRSIFESIGQGDTYFTQWEKEIHPILCEVALTPDQIQQLFTTIEKGSDRTLLGKGVDAAGAAKDKISDVWFNKFGGMLQSSTPVKAFDQKFEEIKSKIAAENPKLAAKLAKYGEFAKDNPKLHKFLLAIAGSVAAALGVAVAGGVGASVLAIGTGTAIAVGIVNIADRLLKGEKASTAIGRGATAGAIAGLTAAGVKVASQALQQLGDVIKIGRTYRVEFNGVSAYVKPEDARAWQEGMAAARGLTKGIDFMSNSEAYFKASSAGMEASAQVAATILEKASDPAYQEAAAAMAKEVIQPGALAQAAAAIGDLASKLNPILSAAAGQAAGGAGEKPTPKESFTVNGKKLSEGQVYMIFNRVSAQQQLTEGPMDWLKTKAKNLTTKVTADKLNSAWKKAGSPTDSEEVAKILTTAGVGDDVVKQVYTDLKLPAPGAAGAEENPAAAQAAAGGYAEVKKAIMQLNTKDRKRMIAYLTKQLGTA